MKRRNEPSNPYRTVVRGKRYETAQLRAAVVLLIPAVLAMIVFFLVPVVQVVAYSFTNYNFVTGTKVFNGWPTTSLLTDTKFHKARGTPSPSRRSSCWWTPAWPWHSAFFGLSIPLKRYLRSAFSRPWWFPWWLQSHLDMVFDPASVRSTRYCPRWGFRSCSGSITRTPRCYPFFSSPSGRGSDTISCCSLRGCRTSPIVHPGRRGGWGDPLQILFGSNFPCCGHRLLVVMIGIINTFKVFAEINVMTPKGGPLYSTALMVVYIYEQAFVNGKMGRACSAAILLFVIIFILTMIQHRMDAKKTISLE